jgi:GNAT superfamily N-acetyltransferase
MLEIRNVESLRQCADLSAGVPSLDEESFQAHQPDVHWVLDDRGQRRARCSTWWSTSPHLADRKVGFIGHYAAADEAAGGTILAAACAALDRAGCKLAVGPVDGSTWRRYRLIVDRGEEPPFFLEPDEPDEYVGHFANGGFAVTARYSSSLVRDLARCRHPLLDERRAQAAEAGVLLRHLDRAHYGRELEAIFALSNVAFAHNFLYTAIGRDEFMAMYEKVKPFVIPELVLLAEKDQRLEGFIFAVPDMLRRLPDGNSDTVVLKTMAVRPTRRGQGLGSLLMAACHEQARQLGFNRAVHALMHEANESQVLSARYAERIRRYALFAREL